MRGVAVPGNLNRAEGGPGAQAGGGGRLDATPPLPYLHQWREGVIPVVAAKDRDSNRVVAAVVDDINRTILNEFVDQHAAEGATVYTDGSSAYRSRENHESVNHSEGESCVASFHTNSVESFWSMLKRAHKGVYHKLSAKHLQRSRG